MADQTALLRAFADYARTISSDYSIGEVLYRLTDHAVEVLGVGGAGVSLGDDDQLRFITATDETVVTVEQGQVDAADGPSHQAHLSGERVTSADLTAEDRWPAYTSLAVQQGCHAVAGIPMRAGDVVIGALNLYRYSPGEWPADELEVAQVLADMASGYIVNARILSASRELTKQLQAALDSRIIIEQANGILAERRGETPGRAFNAMRSYARNHRRKLHDVAQEVVDGTLTF